METKLLFQDAKDAIRETDDSSLSAIITDPPYFLDSMGDTWGEKMTGRLLTNKQTVTSRKSGMKFDSQQGYQFQEFMREISELAFPKLKPGGWFVSFSAPRLYHRLAVAVEDAGYEIRDMWQWLYTQNQMKAMSVLRQFEKDVNLPEELSEQLKGELLEWKTPQVKSCFEPILLAQKPREGTFYNNWKLHHIGLVNVLSGVGTNSDMATSNVITTELISDIMDKTFLVGKPTKTEKGDTTHLSVKPLALMEHLIRVLVPEGGTVMDPFMGSGTTGVAALRTGRRFIGVENNATYYEEAQKRIIASQSAQTTQSSSECFS